MQFLLADFNDVLGLHGTIDFGTDPVLLYGKNLAGKTNVINLIRYCFVSSKAEKKYSEEKRLDRDELLLSQIKTGHVEFYFKHKTKLYKLEYQFKRPARSVNQKLTLSRTTDQSSFGSAADLRNMKWDAFASNVSELKEKFVELGIYQDIIDILISPSNVRNFTDAINDDLITIPDIIARQITTVNKGAEKVVGNLQKLNAVLVQRKVQP